MVDGRAVRIRHPDHVSSLLDLVGELVVAVSVGCEVGCGGGRVLPVTVGDVGGKLYCRLDVRGNALTGRSFVPHSLHRYLNII